MGRMKDLAIDKHNASVEPEAPRQTPYQRHAALGHHMSRYSPNGIDIIEECDDCPLRFIHSPCVGYPITMHPKEA
jgi:hypothetical protein